MHILYMNLANVHCINLGPLSYSRILYLPQLLQYAFHRLVDQEVPKHVVYTLTRTLANERVPRCPRIPFIQEEQPCVLAQSLNPLSHVLWHHARRNTHHLSAHPSLSYSTYAQPPHHPRSTHDKYARAQLCVSSPKILLPPSHAVGDTVRDIFVACVIIGANIMH